MTQQVLYLNFLRGPKIPNSLSAGLAKLSNSYDFVIPPDDLVAFLP